MFVGKTVEDQLATLFITEEVKQLVAWVAQRIEVWLTGHGYGFEDDNGPVDDDAQMMVGRSGIDGSIFEHFCDNDPSPSLLARDVKFNGVEQCSWFSSPLNWWRG